MERLKGKTVFIGRESNGNRLLAGVEIDGKTQVATIGQPGSVPGSVSRYNPQNGAAHCKIEVDAKGRMTITNLKSQNFTFVDGCEISTKKLNDNPQIALGAERFPLDVKAVLTAAAKLMPEAPTSVKHLEKVWDEYKSRVDGIKRSQQSINLLRSLAPIFTLGAGVVSGILGATGGSSTALYITIPLFIIGGILMFYSFVRSKNFDAIKLNDEAQEWLQKNYTCPKCGYIFPTQPYRVLSKNMKKCPGCKTDLATD